MAQQALVQPLKLCAGIVLLLAVFAAVVTGLNRGQFPSQVIDHALPAALYVMYGVSAAGIILGLAHLLAKPSTDKTVETLLGQIRDRLGQQSMPLPLVDPRPTAPPAGLAAGSTGELTRVIELLEELRDTTLMTPNQRRLRLNQLLTTRRRDAAATADALTQQGRLADARLTLVQAIASLGEDAELQAAAQRLTASYAAAEEKALADLTKRVAELVAAEKWDLAVADGEAVIKQYPASARLHDFHAKLLQDREAYTAAVAERLYAEISQASEQRNWRKALATAQELTFRCPSHLRAKQVETKMGLIRENAEIEHRNAMEAQIQELVRTNKPQEAIAVAQELIKTYPLSPQAQIATQLIAKLKELLASQESSPA